MTHTGRRVSRTITPLSSTIIADEPLHFPLSERQLNETVKRALNEDAAFKDLTTIATVVTTRRARAALVARGGGVVAGIPLVLAAFRQLDPKISIRVDVEDGDTVERGMPVMFISGHARALLSAERVAVNFVMHLSGIASLTRRFVDAVRGTRAHILDTRKTIPGLRRLEKYAVRAGGGLNHRLDLADGILIKDNHLAALDGDIASAVRRARALAPTGKKVEVECESREQVEAALAAGADIILLDNMPPPMMRECVQLVGGRALIEASGGVTLDTVRAIAESGVDWISIGKITHSAPALDMALDFDPA